MVSVVMPAYNVEKYISEAIDSIISQTYKDWELIIVDDCSKDGTCDIVERYVEKYSNIKLIKREENSGNPRIPRCDGILVAHGDFICPIDSDDFIEPDYLKKCVSRQNETMADVVSNSLVFCDDDGKVRDHVVPNSKFDLQCVMKGCDATKLTIGGWQISVNGLLIKRDVCDKYFNIGRFNQFVDCAFIDEMDYREILFDSDIVSFCGARYYYRQQMSSVVHNISVKYFNVLQKENLLFEFVEKNYNRNDEIWVIACNGYLSQLLICQRLFLEKKKEYTKEEQKEIKEKIKRAFDFVKEKNMIASGFKQKISLLSYPIFVLISYIYVFYLSLK